MLQTLPSVSPATTATTWLVATFVHHAPPTASVATPLPVLYAKQATTSIPPTSPVPSALTPWLAAASAPPIPSVSSAALCTISMRAAALSVATASLAVRSAAMPQPALTAMAASTSTAVATAVSARIFLAASFATPLPTVWPVTLPISWLEGAAPPAPLPSPTVSNAPTPPSAQPVRPDTLQMGQSATCPTPAVQARGRRLVPPTTYSSPHTMSIAAPSNTCWPASNSPSPAST